MHTLQLSPKQKYQSLVDEGLVNYDSAQQTALNALDDLYYQIIQKGHRLGSVKGLYLWGSVGRGKTFLMDVFTACLPSKSSLRQHFHHFMAFVHQQLGETTGQKDPLKIIALKLSKQYKILCFDEFFVSDIGDAMLLGRLMQYLFEYNVTLVVTSNISPENLYKNGLQRARFLPAIHAVQGNTQSIHLAGQKDHRERALHHQQIYFLETSESEAQRGITTREYLYGLCDLPAKENKYQSIKILGRDIPFLSCNDTAICFDFAHLCEGPRSHFDYIHIATKFQTVVLINVPSLGGYACEQIKARGTEDGFLGSGATGERAVVLATMDDAARRFIALVDEFYERKVKLFLTSVMPLSQLYSQGSLIFEFERARSRLTEMASKEYQELPHQP